MYGIEEWIAESIDEMVHNERIKYAKPGSTCVVITEDEEGHGILQKYMLYFGNKWILVDEQSGSTIITPDGEDFAKLVEDTVNKALKTTVPGMVEANVSTQMEGYLKKDDEVIDIIEQVTNENLVTTNEMGILNGGGAAV
jgi:hypothetical protein